MKSVLTTAPNVEHRLISVLVAGALWCFIKASVILSAHPSTSSMKIASVSRVSIHAEHVGGLRVISVSTVIQTATIHSCSILNVRTAVQMVPTCTKTTSTDISSATSAVIRAPPARSSQLTV